MLFDCISIKMGFEALCLPGLGLPCYAQIAHALMEILPCLLPRGDMQVTSLVKNVTQMASNNGYDLLWRVLYLMVPGCNPAKLVHIPLWQDKDIFVFALLFSLYYCLEAKKGIFHNDRMRSTTLLNANPGPELHGCRHYPYDPHPQLLCQGRQRIPPNYPVHDGACISAPHQCPETCLHSGTLGAPCAWHRRWLGI